MLNKVLKFKKNDRQSRPRVVLVNRCIVFNKKGEFLLVRRSPENYYAAGLYEFPGGKLDEGQDLQNALEREVLEETGLLVIPTDRMAYIESQVIPVGKYKGLPYVVIIGIGKLLGGKLTLSSEHDDYKWVTLKEAYKLPIKDEIRKALIVLSKTFRKSK